MLRLNHLLAAAALVPFALSSCDGGGGSTATDAPTSLSYYGATLSLMLGLPMDPLAPEVEGEVATWSVTPPLPAGLTLNSNTGVLSGTPSATSPLTTHTVTASNAGGATTATLFVGVSGALRHLVAGGDGLASVELFRVDAKSGTPAHDGWFDGEGGLRAMVAHPARPLTYSLVGDAPARLVVHYIRAEEIEPLEIPAPGALNVELPASTSYSMAVDPQGRSLTVTAEDADLVRVYPLWPDGRLKTGAFGEAGVDGARLASYALEGQQLLLAERRAGTDWGLTSYELGPDGLPLDGVDPVHAPLNGFEPVALDSSGVATFAAVSGFGQDLLLRVDLSSGQPVGSSPFPLSARASAVRIQPTRRSLAVLLGEEVDALQRISLDPATLTVTKSGQPVPIGTDPADLAYDATGRFLFVSGTGVDGLLAFETEPSDGALDSRGAFRTRSGAQHLAVVVGDGPVEAHVVGVYASDRGRQIVGQGSTLQDGELHHFDLDEELGTLSQAAISTSLGFDPTQLAVDPRGRRLFVLDSPGNSVYPVAIGSDGALSVAAPLETDLDPRSIALSSTGRVLYVAANGQTQGVRLSSYTVEPETGALALQSTLLSPAAPSALSVDPTGRFLLGTESSAGLVLTFPLLPDGSLDPARDIQETVVANGPNDLLFARSGSEAFVSVRDEGIVRAYFVHPETGALIEKEDAEGVRTLDLGPGTEPRAMVHHPFLRRLYTAASSPSAVFFGDYWSEAPVESLVAGLGLSHLAISPMGRFLFAVDEEDQSLVGMTLDAGAPVLQSQPPYLLEAPAEVTLAVTWQ